MSHELTGDEIAELARVFGAPQQAADLLADAGFPSGAVPDWPSGGGTPFWLLVGKAIADGVMHAGRIRLLDAARHLYPANLVFATPTHTAAPVPHAGRDNVRNKVRADGGSSVIIGNGNIIIPPVPGNSGTADRTGREQPVLRVLFVGASPFDVELDRIRADREFRAIQQAAPKSVLRVGARPAAMAADLADLLEVRPDVLHLCCHSSDGDLIFEDPEGYPHHVPVDTVLNRLLGYHDDADLVLRAIVLSACRSADFAARFTPLAGTVIAWHGDLDDDCAVDFAHEFYRAAVRSPPPRLGSAARIAAREVARCEHLARQLVVLPS